jgi:hypothetical protein
MEKITPPHHEEKPIDTAVSPTPKHVAIWLWQLDQSNSDLVRKHGQKMLNTYFESIEAAELFVLHGE